MPFVCAYISVHMYVNKHVCVCVFVHVCGRLCVGVCPCLCDSHTWKCVCVCVCSCLSVSMHVRSQVYLRKEHVYVGQRWAVQFHQEEQQVAVHGPLEPEVTAEPNQEIVIGDTKMTPNFPSSPSQNVGYMDGRGLHCGPYHKTCVLV